MLPSELADELGTSASAISKQLALYYKETERKRERTLSDDIVEDMREIHRLLQDGQAPSFRQAMLKLQGKLVDPLPADSAQVLDGRMVGLEQRLGRLESKVDQLIQDIQAVLSGQRPVTPALEEDTLESRGAANPFPPRADSPS